MDIKGIIKHIKEDDSKPLTDWQRGLLVGAVGSILVALLLGALITWAFDIQLP